MATVDDRARIPETMLVPEQEYTYECDKGHWITSPTELVRCPAYKHGKPCKAILRTEPRRRKKARPRGRLAD